MPTLSPATPDQAPLLCSDTDLSCSDDLDCADNGVTAATTSTGTLSPA